VGGGGEGTAGGNLGQWDVFTLDTTLVGCKKSFGVWFEENEGREKGERNAFKGVKRG